MAVRKWLSWAAVQTREAGLDSGRRFGACAMRAGLVTSSPRLDGVVEGATQDHVDLDDRLWVEAAGTVSAAMVGELGVETFEVV